MVHSLRTLGAAAMIALAFSACGGGKTTTINKTTTMAQPTTEAQRETAALPQSQVQPVPADLNCGAVKPVWVNLHTKAYHEANDPYYGRTKNGKYMCPSDAAQQGYHAAGAGSNAMSGGAPGTTHHKKKHGSSNY